MSSAPDTLRSRRESCIPLRTNPQLPTRTIQILAEAYELSSDEVQYDVSVLQASSRSGLDLLVWLRARHDWSASTCVYYLAALRRVLRGQAPFT